MTIEEATERIERLDRGREIKDLMLKNLKENKQYREGQCDRCGNICYDFFGVKECANGLPSGADYPLCPEKYENDSETCESFRLPIKEEYTETFMDMGRKHGGKNMEMVTVRSWGKCKICGEEQDLTFGVCGGPCVEIWKSRGKWEWDKHDPNLATLSVDGKKWQYREIRPDKMRS